MDAMKPGPKPGAKYRKTLIAEARRIALAQRLWANPDEARTAIQQSIAQCLERCEEYVTGTAPTVVGEGGGGTILLTDPETGERLTKLNHGAILGYLRELARLCGTDAPTKTETKLDVTDTLAERLAKAQRAVDDHA